VRELAETLSISSSQVYDLIRRAPKPFPPPIRLLGPGSRPKWRVADVDAFLAALAAEEERAARVLPSLEEPPAGALCPSCAEELRLIGYCAACGWRGEESGTC
jgi:predicted DNA-binding transcriptional regulator AlpA